ncbi:hypothetical protein Rrhod_0386 [Rhodococcus rhodnii LMG 5362]|uniref:Uncharacterized protein n=1 Tax=Rhodococcus rhodnii LMG 5362 TaxID=1273125 RepID=R7WSC7_9NOCA|nr:hypothetical protein Rrhod_0386 [Rhodococcus rhodnii LMG 5362]
MPGASRPVLRSPTTLLSTTRRTAVIMAEGYLVRGDSAFTDTQR